MGRAYQNRKESMAKTSDMKAKVYSRYGREIYVSAKSGGADPSNNLSLRSLIDRAKKDQVPTHVIDKAIEKAKGGAGEDFFPARYEGYGPGGSMAIIECLTDNPNRTFGDVRLAFTKTDCKIGTQGSVAHQFDHVAIFVFDFDNEEAAFDGLMADDIDVTDIEYDDGKVSVFVSHTDYFKAKQSLLNSCGEVDFEVDEVQFISHDYVFIEGDDTVLFDKFMTMLDELDDVQQVYHNVKLL
jgi:YebC/PmpR family DNA-binding regulatory protein|tara:strand:- start:11 stop:730 length:720 start_codon:yes stop_codon:yes gene_type:complete